MNIHEAVNKNNWILVSKSNFPISISSYPYDENLILQLWLFYLVEVVKH